MREVVRALLVLLAVIGAIYGVATVALFYGGKPR